MLLAQARLNTNDSKQSIVETFGEVLPDVLIEPIVCRARPHHLQLLTWNGRKLAIADAVERGGVTYKPAARTCGLLSAVRFPKNSTPFESPAKLASSISGFLSRYANLPPDGPSLLTSFALATWFADAFQVAPVLYLVGQQNEADAVLRCLGCICRRPLLLADLDMAALGRLGPRLNPTLLIAQRDLGRAVTHALRASNNRHFHIARGKDILHTYGARAYSADSWSPHDPGLKMCLAPATIPLPVLSEAAEQEFANDFQGKLLRYRMQNFRQVLRAKFDCGDFVPAIRDEVPTWLAPTAGCPDLRETVSAWLLQRSRDLEESRFSDLKCVVAEACLFYCHKPDSKYFFVRELAERVNDLLLGRHEDMRLEDRKVGQLLRDLGIRARRVVKGYRVLLTDAVREQIHQTAHSYQVLSAQDGVKRCRHCPIGQTNGRSN